MLISFIVYIESPDYKGQINRILKSLKKVKYSKKQIEILIHARAANASRIYKIPGPPLIRILPISNINDLIKECHSHMIFVVDEWIKFPKDLLKDIKSGQHYIGEEYYNVSCGYAYPDDLQCMRTASIMRAVLEHRKIHGRWGQLNRKEILRILYRWDQISRWNKVRLLWGWLWGK